MHVSEIFFSSELFKRVQLSNVFADSKTFTDAVPLSPLDEIISKYEHENQLYNFDLKSFVLNHFTIPASDTDTHVVVKRKDIKVHLNDLWNELTRQRKNLLQH